MPGGNMARSVLIYFCVLLALASSIGDVSCEELPESNTVQPDEDTTEPAESVTAKLAPVKSKGNVTISAEDEELYIKAHTYLGGTKAFKHFTLEDTRNLVDEVESWVAPEEMRKDFPYYLSGYDYDNRPIWVAEVGKYDPRKYVNEGAKAVAMLEKYGFQAALRALKSAYVKDEPGKEVREFVMIADADGLDIGVVTHPASIAFAIHYGRLYWDIAEKCLGQMILLNANYATQVALQLAKPVVGRLMERVEVFGTNKQKFMSVLRRKFPPESIPPWYGGNKDYKPIAVY